MMICSMCGGRVEWQGRLSNLTHTKCLSCGQINCQEADPSPDIACNDSVAWRCSCGYECVVPQALVCPDCGKRQRRPNATNESRRLTLSLRDIMEGAGNRQRPKKKKKELSNVIF